MAATARLASGGGGDTGGALQRGYPPEEVAPPPVALKRLPYHLQELPRRLHHLHPPCTTRTAGQEIGQHANMQTCSATNATS
jgi:hypothetical protein